MVDHRALQQAVSLLREAGVTPQVSASLATGMKAAGTALRQAILSEVKAFSTSANPEILPSLETHAGEHMQEMLRLYGGGEVGDFEFVRLHAQRRAEQRFPLDAILHAYRCGHRVLSRWMRDATIASGVAQAEAAVSAVADFAIEYTNSISTIMAAEYVAHARLLAEAEGDQRTELLGVLLSGYDESDARVTRLLQRAGYLEQRHAYCVVAVQPVIAAEMEQPERAQRIIAALASAIAATRIRMLAGVRDGMVVAVLSDVRRQSGWTAAQASLGERLYPLLLGLGPAVVVGMSSDHPSTSYLQRALQEAAMSLDFASVTRRVVRFAELPVRSLMLHRGGDYIRSATPAWLSRLMEANAKANGALVATLRVMADSDLNVQEAGRRLSLHPNTVYARLARIRELTGHDGQRHHDLVELLLAVDSLQG
jgi:hypothetical protein